MTVDPYEDEKIQMYNLAGEYPELPSRLLAWPDFCTQVARAESAERRLMLRSGSCEPNRAGLIEFAQRVEDDRREPDKLLCHVQSMRRAAGSCEEGLGRPATEYDHKMLRDYKRWLEERERELAAALDRVERAEAPLSGSCEGEMRLDPITAEWLPIRSASCEEERRRLTGALKQIAELPGVTMRGAGRDRHGVVDGHERAVVIARAALTADGSCEPNRAGLIEFAQRVEDDRREPDKLLCHVQSMRRAAGSCEEGRGRCEYHHFDNTRISEWNALTQEERAGDTTQSGKTNRR
jgi:hypothetical protein